MTNQVDHPPHYNLGPKCKDGTAVYEPIKVIEGTAAGFCVGNALKYIARASHKGSPKQDLEKALWYLNRDSDLVGPSKKYEAEEVAAAWALDVGLTTVVEAILRSSIPEAAQLLKEYLD